MGQRQCFWSISWMDLSEKKRSEIINKELDRLALETQNSIEAQISTLTNLLDQAPSDSHDIEVALRQLDAALMSKARP